MHSTSCSEEEAEQYNQTVAALRALENSCSSALAETNNPDLTQRLQAERAYHAQRRFDLRPGDSARCRLIINEAAERLGVKSQ